MLKKQLLGRNEPFADRRRSVLAFALTGTGAAVALTSLRAAPIRVARELAHPRRWLDALGVDAAAGTLAAAALWLLAAWLVVGVVAAVAGRLPGAAGAFARWIAIRTLPRALYRAGAGAAGLGILLSPAVASAAAPHPGGTAAVSTAVPSPLPPTSSLRAPQLPVEDTPHVEPSLIEAEHAAKTRTVTVRPGDSLWRIAATHLGRAPTAARVAAAWPRWFGANRAVIGADPDLLLPGEVLHAPHSPKDQR